MGIVPNIIILGKGAGADAMVPFLIFNKDVGKWTKMLYNERRLKGLIADENSRP